MNGGGRGGACLFVLFVFPFSCFTRWFYIYMCCEVKQAEMRVQAVRVFICLFYMSRFCNSNKKVCRRMHIYKCVPAFGLVWLVRVRMVKI